MPFCALNTYFGGEGVSEFALEWLKRFKWRNKGKKKKKEEKTPGGTHFVFFWEGLIALSDPTQPAYGGGNGRGGKEKKKKKRGGGMTSSLIENVQLDEPRMKRQKLVHF